MCGINGILGLEKIDSPEVIIQKMNLALAHRGPDNDGFYQDNDVVIGHRRLSIIDTSSAGNQPFISEDNQTILALNGEIYNYLEIKNLLSEYNFKTKTDTEVVLAAYLKWGIQCLDFFNGMFAISIWDRTKKKLFIARDRLGIKPLYYTESESSFIFSSELRAIKSSELVPFKLSQSHLIEYLRYQTVHAPRTLINGVYTIPPGHYLELSDNERKLTKYWSPIDTASKKSKNPSEPKRDIKELLQKSVELRMRADVPFGAFLSGGIDSSAIVGLMSEISSRPVSTFSVVFNEREFSEAPYAELISKKFHSDHHEILLKPEDFLNEIPNALGSMDHPSGDGPNTYIVSQVTKNSGITMALSGLGGDELFAGYSIFKRSISLHQKKWLNSFAGVFRNAAGSFISAIKPSIASNKIQDILRQEYVDIPHAYSVNRKVLFDDEIFSILNLKEKIKNPLLTKCIEIVEQAEKSNLDVISQVSLLEMDSYMQNVLLRDSDQMSMAHALEIRVPFLDHNLVEYAVSLSDNIKFPNTPKQLLVDSLGDLLPSEIVNRPKMGFVLPWENWLKTELNSFAKQKLDKLGERPEFNKSNLLNLWDRFCKGDQLITWSRVWPLVVLADWIEQNEVE